jgi:hypothetical protein
MDLVFSAKQAGEALSSFDQLPEKLRSRTPKGGARAVGGGSTFFFP